MALQPQNRSLAAERGQPATTAPRRRGGWRPHRQLEGYLFLLPSFVGFLLFTALPVLAAFALSFVDWNLLKPPVFVGTANYVELLTRDRIFRQALWNTLYFTVTIVPLQLALGLALAVALNQAIRGITLYRLIYFMRGVTSIVRAALVFQWMFNEQNGVISAVL